jgi:hypothetical protein
MTPLFNSKIVKLAGMAKFENTVHFCCPAQCFLTFFVNITVPYFPVGYLAINGNCYVKGSKYHLHEKSSD